MLRALIKCPQVSIRVLQGMNSGLQDSVSYSNLILPAHRTHSVVQFNLAWKLALVEKELAPQSLLDSYSQERLPVIATMLDKTTQLFKSEFVSKAKDLSKWKRGKDLSQLGVNYRGSPITVDELHTETSSSYDTYGPVEEDTPKALHSGDRAPDASGLASSTTATATSVFDLLGTSYHTIMVFSRDIERHTDQVAVLQETLATYSTGLIRSTIILPQGTRGTIPPRISDHFQVLTDEAGHAYRVYAPDDQYLTVVIVRPDGVVGGLLRNADGVKEYFAGIFI